MTAGWGEVYFVDFGRGSLFQFTDELVWLPGLVIHFLGPGCARMAPRISLLLPDDWSLLTGVERGPIVSSIWPQTGDGVGYITIACPCSWGWGSPCEGEPYTTTYLGKGQGGGSRFCQNQWQDLTFLLPHSSFCAQWLKTRRWYGWTSPLSAWLTLPVSHAELKSERNVLLASTASPCPLTPSLSRRTSWLGFQNNVFYF